MTKPATSQWKLNLSLDHFKIIGKASHPWKGQCECRWPCTQISSSRESAILNWKHITKEQLLWTAKHITTPNSYRKQLSCFYIYLSVFYVGKHIACSSDTETKPNKIRSLVPRLLGSQAWGKWWPSRSAASVTKQDSCFSCYLDSPRMKRAKTRLQSGLCKSPFPVEKKTLSILKKV